MKDMPIYVRIKGGIGNQLFQMAFGYFLRDVYGSRVIYDLSWFKKEYSNRAMTSLIIDVSHKTTYNRVLRRFFVSIDKYAGESDYSNDNTRSTYSLRPNLQRYRYFDGYFQHAEIAAYLKNYLLSKMFEQNTIDSVDAIAVHIRRGDYLNQTVMKIHGLCSIGYYVNSVSLLRSTLGDLPVHVFTDSPEYVAQEIPRTWILRPSSSSHEHDLLAMSSYRGLVTSNSTFSWWSAFLKTAGGSRADTVVLPWPWFTNPTSADNNLFVPGWNRVLKS